MPSKIQSVADSSVCAQLGLRGSGASMVPVMSLLNAWILPDEAIIAVDTDGVDDEGIRMPTSKLLLVPHLNAVLALRGQLALLSFLLVRSISSALDSFDALCDAMPAMLGEAAGAIPGELVVASPIDGFELVAAGWSARRSRMAARLFVKRGDMPDMLERDVDRFVSPWNEAMQGVTVAPQALDKIARAQVRWMRETFPGAACGGRLIVCRLTRRSATLEHGYEFQRLTEAAA